MIGNDAEPVADSARSRWWLWNVLGWDGGLPLAVALTPELFHWLEVQVVLTDLLAGLLIPMAAALVRASRASHQLARAGNRQGNWWRQILLAVAICVLLVFEVGLNIIILDMQRGNGQVPQADGLMIAGCLYLAYLAMMLVALKPNRFSPV